jgi:hypothetical protein
MNRRDDTPEILWLAFMFCCALAVGGWLFEVLHG